MLKSVELKAYRPLIGCDDSFDLNILIFRVWRNAFLDNTSNPETWRTV